MEFHFKIKDLVAIPNILCYLRIIMVGVFLYIYNTATSQNDYYIAMLVVMVAGITDFLDGRIARKFNMITDLGKVIDPVADKLMQFAMLITLTFNVKNMYMLTIYLIIKEVVLALIAFIILKTKGRRLNGAKWYGKVCTAVLYVVMLVFVAVPQLNAYLRNALLIVCAAAITLSFVMYIRLYIIMIKDSRHNTKNVLY
jgi:cardiolipin synthase